MTLRKRGALNTINQLCASAFVVFFLISLLGAVGCSDSGGGGNKSSYHLTGYDGYQNKAGNSGLEFYSEFPWFVNLTFQVQDEDQWGISGLTENDFVLIDDGVEVSKDASELNVRKRGTLPADYSYTLKTVLFLDNSPSEEAGLDKIKEAAQVIIDNLDEKKQQLVAIMAFDENGNPKIFQDFSDDPTELQKILAFGDTAGSIQPSFGTTNFYGAVIEGLSLWDDALSPGETDFQQGVMVAITDGKDTSNLFDVDDAIAKRKFKQVITVAVGSDVSSSISEDLQKLGNAGYYPVPNPNQQADEQEGKKPQDENLCEWMLVIQSRMIAYADSFYWLQYRSDATSKDANSSHAVALEINNNNKDATDARISGTYSSDHFFSGDPSIYFDASTSDPDGITEKPIMLERGQGAGEVAETISALTYKQTGARPSEYEWTSGDTSIVTVLADADDSSRATITVVSPGDVTLTVKDMVNNISQTLAVNVKVREESFEMIRHVVTSAPPWFADATFQVRKTESENNQWEWVTDLAREDMTVLENGEKIDMENSELHLRKRDNIPSSYSYTLKTVLLIDNSPSSRAENNLELIKQAAKAFAKRALINDPNDRSDLGPLLDANNETPQQEIAVVSYDEDGETILVRDFTTDLDTVTEAIDDISRGFGPIDFYDGMLTSLDLWQNEHFPYNVDEDFVQGMVIVLSDGWQSVEGFYDRQSVLDAIGSKQVVCVSVGNDLVSGNSDDLIAFGNAGFYSVPDPGQTTKIKVVFDNGVGVNDVTYTALERTLMKIQDEAAYPYANSFYWLNYTSKLDRASTCSLEEFMVITINNNSNTGAGRNVSGRFESCYYFEGIDNKIYVNHTTTNPGGITGSIELQYVTMDNLFLSDPMYPLKAITYDDDGFRNTPAYEWTITSPFVRVTPVPGSRYNSEAVMSLPAVKQEGNATLRVDDIGNGSPPFTLNVGVVEKTIPTPLAYYLFNGDLTDGSGNGFDLEEQFGSPVLTEDRCNEQDKAYSFSGTSGRFGSKAFTYSENGAFDEITICAWVRSDSNETQTIVTLERESYWALDLFDSGQLRWITTDSDDKTTILTVPGSYNDNQWHFICAWFKAGSGAADKKIYVDGQLIGSQNGHDGKSLGNGNSRILLIGDNHIGNPNYWFKGDMDDIMIFDRALTEDQITTLSNLQCIE